MHFCILVKSLVKWVENSAGLTNEKIPSFNGLKYQLVVLHSLKMHTSYLQMNIILYLCSEKMSCTEKGWRELLQRYSATVPKSLFRRAIRRMRCCEPDTWIRYVVSKVENPDGIEEWEYALYGWCMMKWEKHLQAWVCKCFLRLCGPAWAWTRDLQIMSLLL